MSTSPLFFACPFTIMVNDKQFIIIGLVASNPRKIYDIPYRTIVGNLKKLQDQETVERKKGNRILPRL